MLQFCDDSGVCGALTATQPCVSPGTCCTWLASAVCTERLLSPQVHQLNSQDPSLGSRGLSSGQQPAWRPQSGGERGRAAPTLAPETRTGGDGRPRPPAALILLLLYFQASCEPLFELSFAFPEKWYSKCRQFPGLSQAQVTADSAPGQAHNGSCKLTRPCSQRGRVPGR